MAMATASLGQKELEDLKPYLDKAVQRFVGLKDPDIVNTAVSLLASGADKKEVTNKLRNLHPALVDTAHKLTEVIFEMAAEIYANALQSQQKLAKKRLNNADNVETLSPHKIARTVDSIDGGDLTLSSPASIASALPILPGGEGAKMSSHQIQEMMANAKRLINARKQELARGVPLPPPQVVSVGAEAQQLPPGIVVPPVVVGRQPPAMQIPIDFEQNNNASFAGGADDKKKRVEELKAQIASKLAAGGFKPDEEQPSKPLPLLLDSEGRAVDVSGKQLLFPTRQPTLKANIRAQKKVELKTTIRENKAVTLAAKKAEEEEEETAIGNKYFDERLAPSAVLKKGLDRKKKALKFNDPGKYVALAQKQRMNAKLANLKQEIADNARKTGIANAARLAKLSGTAGLGDKSAEYIPQVEWWDCLLLDDDGGKPGQDLATYDSPIKLDSITNLIEHPTQVRCPTEPSEAVHVPVYLTKREQKKLRRQNRRETWKEKQEKIRLGLEPAPPPKATMSNIMRVLGDEAVQDPTKVEQHVRAQMAKRLKTHQDANAARKLTPAQKKAKKARKLQEDVSLGARVSVYRIDCLANQSKRFKIDTNARQLHMTGVVVMYRECNVVVVEGGPKQQSKYRKLIMQRIKWDEDRVRDKEDQQNKCVLVWEGMVKDRAFTDFKFKPLKTEELVRDFFKRYGVQNYWDAALSGTVLEAVLEND